MQKNKIQINFHLLNQKNKQLYKKNKKNFYKIFDFVIKEIKNTSKEIELIELSLIFCDSQTIKKYNKNYLNKNNTTDVLSFPQNEIHNKIYQLGDILINTELLEEQFKKDELNQKVLYLFMHGCLHMIGYNHITNEDEKIMSEKEDQIFEHIGFYNDKLI